MPSGPSFPAFLRLEHQRDGSAKASFLAEVDSITGDAKGRFDRAFGEIAQTINKSLAGFKNAGQFGLKFDIPGLKQAAADAEFARQRLIAVRDAAVSLARSSGDTSRETQTYITALRAQVIEAERAAKATQAQATTYERLQGELDKTVAGNKRLADSYRAVEIARGAGNTSTGARGPDGRFGVDRLLAGQASIDKAALSATTLNQVLGRVSQSYSQVAVAADGAAQAARRGTEANHLVVNSTRSVRVATVQAGQQLQDIGISLYSGQRAAVVFAQQLPQLAFALSGLEGSANKTHDRIGRFATFLAGPWGLAVGLAVGVAGTLIASLFDMGEKSDKAKTSTIGLSEALTKAKVATDEGRKAIDEYNVAQQKQRDNADVLTKLTLAQAEARLKDAVATREQLAAELARQRAFASDPRNVRGEGDAFSAAFATGPLEAALAKNAGDLARLTDLAGNLRIKDAQRDAEAAADPIRKINNYYEDMAAVATAAAKGNLALEQSLKGVLTQIEKQKAAALETARAKDRPARGGGTGASRDDALGGATALIKDIFGAGTQITSTLRKGDRGDHGRGRAIDFVPEGGLGKYTTAEVEALLEAAGLDIRYGRGGNKQIFGPDRGAKTPNDHNDHFHVGFNGSPSPEGADRAFKAQAEKALREQQQLAEFGERSAEAIARINERFNEQPRLIDAANQSTRKLDDTIAELAERKPPGFEQLIADAETAKGVIEEALVRPFAEIERDSQRRIKINGLLAQGREDEAEALQTIWQLENTLGPLTNERKEGVFAIAAAERAASEELAKQQEIVGAYLDATRSIRSEIEGLLSGDKPNFKRIFKELRGKILFEQLFGDTFRKLEKSILRETGIEQSVDKLAKDTTRAGNSASGLADVFDQVASRILASANGDTSVGSVNSAFDSVFGGKAANDNAGRGINAGISLFGAAFARAKGGGGAGGLQPNGDIVVTGKKNDGTVGNMSTDAYRQLLTDSFSKSVIGKALDQVVGGLSGVVGGGLAGLATGGIPGGVIGALKGIKGLPEAVDKLFKSSNVLGKAADGAATGTAVAGIAKAFGFKKFSTTGSQIGGAIGSALPIPGGQIIGSIIGGTIGGLLKKTKTGSATLSIGADGVQVGSTGGNSGSRKKGASSAGDSISESINRIAEQLGGEATGPISVSIGIRDKSFRVDPSGRGQTKVKKGAVDFGQDQEAAIKFAIADALKDGVITGIKAATQRLLTSGKDIDQQLQKALDFEGVFTRLRQRTDPVGAAIEVLNKEFSRLDRIFAEAGASAAEYADLEKLYALERADAVKQANEAIVGSLRSLYDDLTIGNDALSLRDRRTAALARYDPLKARVAAGDSTAFDDFATAARSLLDIERQASGSQGGYFARLDEVTSLSKAQLDRNAALADAAQASDSPFVRSATASNDNQGVIDAVETGNALLTAINTNLGALLAQGTAAQGGLYLPQAVNYF